MCLSWLRRQTHKQYTPIGPVIEPRPPVHYNRSLDNIDNNTYCFTGLCSKLDIVFVLDSSGSVNKNNWQKVRNPVKLLLVILTY